MKFIMASHGDLAKTLVKTAEMIIGKQPSIMALGLYPETDLESFKEELTKEIIEEEGEVLVLLDFLGGTPFNSIIQTLQNERVQFVVGMNLGMLLELLLDSTEKNAIEAARFAKEKGIQSIVTKEDIL